MLTNYVMDSEIFIKNIKYYGSNDFAGGFFVKQVCENIDYLESVAPNIGKKIDTIEGAYCFLWCLSFKQMSNDICKYNISDDLKERIQKLSDILKPSDSAFVNYINKKYSDVFNKQNHEKLEWFDFFYYVLDLCFGRYCRGIDKSVFHYLETNFALHILSHFEACANYYSKNKKDFEYLFKDLRDTRLFDDQIYLRFLLNANNKCDSFLKEQATFICKRTLIAIKAMNLTEDSQDIAQVQSFIKEYGKLAVLYKLKCANEYSVLKKKIQVTFDSFVKKHGVNHKIGPYDLTPAMDILKSSKDGYRFIQITHNKNKDGKIENALDYILNITNKNNPISEDFNDISRNRSKRYPYYKQDSMQLNLWIRMRIINMLFNDKDLVGDFINYMYNVALQVQEKYFSNLINIEKEITGEVDCFLAMMDLARQKQFDSPYAKALVYNNSLALCSTIEKILRNIALKEVKDKKYFDTSKATLAEFFRTPFQLKDISEGLKYHLEFYLIKEVNFHGYEIDRPGLNIRNNIMHGQDDAYEKTDYGTCLTLFYYLVSLMDDLLIAMEHIEDENL